MMKEGLGKGQAKIAGGGEMCTSILSRANRKPKMNVLEYGREKRALQEEGTRYGFLYNLSPVALCDADCSKLRGYIERLKKSGVMNFGKHFEDHPEAVAACLKRLKVLHMNEAMVSLLGDDKKGRIKGGLEDFFDAESSESFQAAIIAYAEGKTTFESETRIKNSKGERREVVVKWAVVSGPDSSRSRMLIACDDLTDLRKAEEDTKKFKTMCDRAHIGNAICDLNGNVTYVNEAYARMHGYDVDELIGKNFSCLYKEEELDDLQLLVAEVFEKGGLENIEMCHVKKDGTIISTLSNTTAIKDETGAAVFLSTTAVDMTEYKAMQEELEEKYRNLEEANIALKVVFENGQRAIAEIEERVVHNVKTVLTPFVEKLKKTGLTQEQEACLKNIEYSLKNIIESFSEKLAGKYQRLTPAEIQVASLIKEGKRSKEIAEILNLAKGTVDVHRENIRKKLGICNKRINLQVFLASIS